MSSGNGNGDGLRKSIPETVYRKHLARAKNSSTYFIFVRDYIKITKGKTEALFLQDVMNHADSAKPEYQIEGNGKVWSLCTVEYLKQSLDWDEETQRRLLRSLEKQGYIDTKRYGSPPRRYVWVDIKSIEDALDALDSSQSKRSDSNPTDRRVMKPTDRRVMKPTETCTKREEKRKEKNKTCRSHAHDGGNALIPSSGNEDTEVATEYNRRFYAAINRMLKSGRQTGIDIPRADLGLPFVRKLMKRYSRETLDTVFFGWYLKVMGQKDIPHAFCVKSVYQKSEQILERYHTLHKINAAESRFDENGKWNQISLEEMS